MVFKFKLINMKKLILISFLFISIGIYSQGNLQFNRVINLEYTQNLNGNAETLLESITLEENKVWKVVSASITEGDFQRGGIPLYRTSNDVGLFINKTKIYAAWGSLATTISNQSVRMPIWISSGSGTKNILAYMVNANINPYTISISIIEFNVVP